VTIASPFGNSSTCVCYQNIFGDGGLGRQAIGGCAFASGKSLELTPGCSTALWHMPRTRFIEEYELGFGFGEKDEKNAPFGTGFYNTEAKVSAAAKTFNNDADHSWDGCLGVPDKLGPENPIDTTAPCYKTYDTQKPDVCTCVDKTAGTMADQCKVLSGESCPLDVRFTNQALTGWTAKGLVQGCFPAACSNKDVVAITQYVIDEWVPNATDVNTYRLTDIAVPSSCGGGGGSKKKGSSGATTGEIAGGVIGALVIVGAGGFFFMKRRGGGGGGLGTKLVANRGTLF